jgi:tRNA A-37 threonylcarbamoyl transferase component Bud32
LLLKDSSGKLRSGAPTMFACAPVRDENLQVVAVLAMRIRPEAEFTAILQLGRIGQTGETYAVNKEGVMVSNSRFDEEMILVGLLPDVDGAASILNVQVRDPGGNLLEGFRPTVRRREQPLTAAAAAVTAGGTGSRLDGYRDYRGVPKVGAWTWLPEYEIGVVTEIAFDEAFRPLAILKWTFFSLYALLGLAAAAIFVFTLVVARLRREAQKAEIEAKQLGQYRLLEEIGSGAMGVVYKAQHAMLRRPTAIKMLNVERVDEASIQRFEREVQITCNLNNPHTVAIYDYGRTPEGVFYYAMEYLDGIDLQSLVERDGPQPEGRVASILRQVCASLYEAHSLGLVHRDVKPANVMLNRRGGEPDVVKVLDFGLVKALEDERGSASAMSGTPLYMSPEAIQTPDLVDARSDLYAVGAVGFFLLTGETAFRAQTLSELCEQHVAAIPDSPSQRLGRPVSPELEHAILACLEKNRSKRPQTARDLAAMLDRVPSRWTLDDAEAWWRRYERERHRGRTPPGAGAAESAATTRTPAEQGKQGSAAQLERTGMFESPEDAADD